MEIIDFIFICVAFIVAVTAIFYRIYCDSFSGRKIFSLYIPIDGASVHLHPLMNSLKAEGIIHADLLRNSVFQVELKKGDVVLWQKEVAAPAGATNLHVPISTFMVSEPGEYFLFAKPVSEWKVSSAQVVLRRNVLPFSTRIFVSMVVVFLLSVIGHVIIKKMFL
jgi:hypothetical protein